MVQKCRVPNTPQVHSFGSKQTHPVVNVFFGSPWIPKTQPFRFPWMPQRVFSHHKLPREQKDWGFSTIQCVSLKIFTHSIPFQFPAAPHRMNNPQWSELPEPPRPAGKRLTTHQLPTHSIFHFGCSRTCAELGFQLALPQYTFRN